MVVELPALSVVIPTALVDSINPCAIGVLILMLTTLLKFHYNKKKMLTLGIIYIAAVYITYFLAGIGLLFFIQKLNIAEPLGIFVGALIIVLGLIEIKDFWWYGKGVSLHIAPKRVEQIKKYLQKISFHSAIILGIFVAAVELPCTGGPYLAITTLLAKIGFDFTVVSYLLFYNLIFVLPLIVILTLVYFGLSTKKIRKWKEKEKKWMRFWTGVVMIILGILLILFTTKTINFVIY